MTRLFAPLFVLALLVSACSSAPGESGLRDSFAQQLASNRFLTDFARDGDTLTFKAPSPDGTPAAWRVHIDSVKIEPQENTRQPFKGTVASSWFVNGQQVAITGADSNLPRELTSNGLGQECWALWEPGKKTWGWE